MVRYVETVEPLCGPHLNNTTPSKNCTIFALGLHTYVMGLHLFVVCNAFATLMPLSSCAPRILTEYP